MEPCPMPRPSSARLSARCWATRCLTGWGAALVAGSAGYGRSRVTPMCCREVSCSSRAMAAKASLSAVFSARSGPVVPLAAGIMQMPRGRFWFANVTSALVWAPMLLLAGDLVGEVGDRLIGSTNTVLLVFGGLILIGIGWVVWAALRAARPKP